VVAVLGDAEILGGEAGDRRMGLVVPHAHIQHALIGLGKNESGQKKRAGAPCDKTTREESHLLSPELPEARWQLLRSICWFHAAGLPDDMAADWPAEFDWD